MPEARFKPGERVKVLKAYPLGHVRTPYYIRGCTGTVERICGAFPNPEELAQMRDGLPPVRRLLENGTKACEELGLDVPALKLVAVENTPAVHNAIVCTLCSCYPRMLLGIPPEWYKSRAYRSRMVREPRSVLAEFGLVIPEKTQIRVHDSTADMRYIVLPMRPAGTEGWSEERLAALVNRDCMIGVAVPRGPKD
jgi:hypothetical protein